MVVVNSVSPPRWMQAEGHPIASQLHYLMAVHTQRYDGCSTYSGKTNNLSAILAPGKVITPDLIVGMVKGNLLATLRIKDRQTCCFVPIAGWTTEAEIVRFRLTPS